MSTTIYPVGLITRQTVEAQQLAVMDAFEDGSSSSRRLWADKFFKRQFTLLHAPLKPQEFAYLRGFYTQRGLWDTFWFRDNANRGGNALARFSKAISEVKQGSVYFPASLLTPVVLDESAAIRRNPEIDEVTAAAGTAPIVWLDANRETYIQHAGAVYTFAPLWDNCLTFDPSWQTGALNLQNVLGQWQSYQFDSTQWSKSVAAVTQLGTGAVPCTVFAICRHSTTATKQVLFGCGALGSKKAFGLVLNASSQYEPWFGDSTVWSPVVIANSPADTWRSLTCVFSGGSTQIFANAVNNGNVLIATGAYTAGPLSLGAAMDGTLPANPGNAMTNADITHVLVFPAALSIGQVAAVHNLFAYQFGLPAA